MLLLTGAALGDRYGRRRMFIAGLGLFTAGSAAAALAPGIGWLIAARAVQGVGGAVLIPLTLTLLSAAVSLERRGLASAPGARSAVSRSLSARWSAALSSKARRGSGSSG
ncbi:MAG TPA: MFS transporter [Streptosporangiaceae bacterium]|nr:MFS transporter [Streptosporangiaceae bacterium]